MASVEEKVAALEKNITDLRGTLDQYAIDIETTRQRSMKLIEDKSVEIEQNSILTHAKVHELYEISNKTISYLAGRVCALEAAEEKEERGQFGYPSSPKNLVPAKNMVPVKLMQWILFILFLVRLSLPDSSCLPCA